jgi:hypothetical protein
VSKAYQENKQISFKRKKASSAWEEAFRVIG